MSEKSLQLLTYIPGSGWVMQTEGWVDHNIFIDVYRNVIETGLFSNVEIEMDFENVAFHHDDVKSKYTQSSPWYYGSTLIGSYLRWRLAYPKNNNWRYDFTRAQMDPAFTNAFVWMLIRR